MIEEKWQELNLRTAMIVIGDGILDNFPTPEREGGYNKPIGLLL
jgi:hypothetical protein